MTSEATVTISAEDQAAVAAFPQRIVSAWAEHDAAAFAAAFVEDGTLILPGVSLAGRAEIESFLTRGFAGPYKGTQVIGTPFRITGLADGVVLVLTKGGVLAPGESEVAPEREIRASWLLVRRNGEWLLAAYQNSPANLA